MGNAFKGEALERQEYRIMILAEKILRFRVDDCVYPEGGTLGPRVQTSLQLFYVSIGHAHVLVDGDERHALPQPI